MDDICGTFIAYFPSTFSYDGPVGIGEEDNDVEMNPDDGITPEAIAEKMRCLVNDLLAPDVIGDLTDSATEDNSGTYNAATDVTNGAKARQGEIKNAKIVLAVEIMLACADITHLSKLAIDVSSFLDTNDRGYISNERNSKSLRWHWICSSGRKSTSVTNSSNEGNWIERGTILTLGVTLGRGNAATIVFLSSPIRDR